MRKNFRIGDYVTLINGTHIGEIVKLVDAAAIVQWVANSTITQEAFSDLRLVGSPR